MKNLGRCVVGAVIVLQVFGGAMVVADDKKNSAGNVIQFGTMHEAIGQQQHQGRVRFADLLNHPHFFGVAALESLHGEATIFDGNVTVTTVDDQGQLLPVKSAATLPTKASLLFVPAK